MAIFVTVFGIVVVATGLVLVVAPEWFVDRIKSVGSAVGFRSAVAGRLVLGVALLWAAPSCRLPDVVNIFWNSLAHDRVRPVLGRAIALRRHLHLVGREAPTDDPVVGRGRG